MALSERGTKWALPDDSMLLWTVIQDLWHPETNSTGFVSLGVAENTLMHDTLSKHIKSNFDVHSHGFTYGDGPRGTTRLRNAVAKFLTEHLRPTADIKPSQITITNGCTSALENLAFVLGNPGEEYLLGQPHYGAFTHDLSMRAGTSVRTVAFHDVDPFSLEAVRVYEDALIDSQRNGKKVAGLILCNPHNPLGRSYPSDTIIELLRLCEKYKIHLVADEIYALSIWKNNVDTDPAPVKFRSVLSLDLDGVIDPSRIHVIWGTSKDFGANGLRLGAVISQHNQSIHKALLPISLFSSASSLAENATANILEDHEFVQAYIAENRRLLSERYSLATAWAKKNDITYRPGVNAAFFLWVDLGSAYKNCNPGAEVEDLTATVMQALLKARVFLASGKQFGSERPGWFRIVFSHPTELLEEGLKRILLALKGERPQ